MTITITAKIAIRCVRVAWQLHRGPGLLDTQSFAIPELFRPRPLTARQSVVYCGHCQREQPSLVPENGWKGGVTMQVRSHTIAVASRLLRVVR